MKKAIIVLAVIIVVLGGILFWQNKTKILSMTTLGGKLSTVITSSVLDKRLDLSNRGLARIPDGVFGRNGLEELNVSHNSLSGAIQSQIGQLKNLKKIDASYNDMTGVPAEIGQLSKLEILDLSNNKLTGLPNELGNLKNLKILNLSGNRYSPQDLAGIRSQLPKTVNIILN